MIDSVWAAFVEVGARLSDPWGSDPWGSNPCGSTGGPFRRWRCSPPVVKWGAFYKWESAKSRWNDSQKTLLPPDEIAVCPHSPRLLDMGTGHLFRQPKSNLYPGKMYFYNPC